LLEIISEVKKRKYDIIICPHRSFRSALITYFSKAQVRIGFETNSMSFLLTAKVPYVKESHEVQRNLDLIGVIPEIEADDSKISAKAEFFPTAKDEKLVDALIERVDKEKLIALAPCSKWFTKQLTKEKTIEICKAFFKKGYGVVLIGGAEDFNYCGEVQKELDSDKLINLCGRLSPLQSYLAISKSKVLITVDSAAQHLGGASDVPIVLIYGSTNKSFGFYPLTSRFEIIENTELTCRPCTDHGRAKCPLGHFKCIVDLDAGKIVETAMKLIGE
ncbi:MAG: glycosyltransferase family 9 protein, partial [Bacteroidia bacterium]